jgi:hypothetical protein
MDRRAEKSVNNGLLYSYFSVRTTYSATSYDKLHQKKCDDCHFKFYLKTGILIMKNTQGEPQQSFPELNLLKKLVTWKKPIAGEFNVPNSKR